ncbi:restriction endonuclease subunit S, partial [Macrococcus hajekii]
MSEKNENIPKRRFKEFENAPAWEQRKVEDMCEVSTGKGNTKDKSVNGKYPFYVRSENIEKSD